jgi:nitrate/nitrite-specific signal transduction histidine kinase
MNELTQHLNAMKAELQTIYDDLEHEIRSTDNQELIDNGFTVVETLSSALDELETLIGDIDNGIYNKTFNTYEDDGMSEDEN